MKRAFLIFGMFLFISGCANHPLDCATGLIAWDDCKPGTLGYEKRQDALKQDDELCKSYGLVFGTAEYAQCRIALKGQSEANKRAALSILVKKPVTCTSSAIGSTSTTTCQ